MNARPFLRAAAVLAVLAIVVTSFPSCARPVDDGTLVIYAYDSFAGEWGPGPVVIPAFEKATGIKVELLAMGDGGQVLARAIEEKKKPRADVVIGIDNHLAPRALASGILSAYEPAAAARVPADLRLDGSWRLTPFDWGAFAIIWDSEKLAVPPASLDDLAAPAFAGKLILMDPRTSTPGLGFLAWTKAVYGDGLAGYWKRLAPSVLTMAPGWDMGYGLFTSGEAPLVLSYTTSPAYHAEYESAGRYRALIFPEGHPVQIEGAGILKGAAHREAAEAFIEFMLGDEFQAAIPLTNWMYPVVEGTPLPASFEWAPRPGRLLRVDASTLEGADRAALDAFGTP